MKKQTVFSLRVSAEDLQRIQDAAKRARTATATWARSRLLADMDFPSTEDSSRNTVRLPTYHIDDLGPDNLRVETHALPR